MPERNAALRGASIAVLAAVAAGAVASRADAAAFYLQEQSTKASGRAYSGEVSERGAQQMWWNPAAIGGISGMQSYGGATAILPHADASNIGTTVERPLAGGATTPVGGLQNEHDPVNKGYLPNGGVALPLGDRLAVGLTVTSPYSFTTHYKPDSWARYSADKSRLRTFDIQPAIAFSPAPEISIGAGPNVEYLRATLSNYLPDPVSPAFSDGHQYLKGDGWDVGYSFGFQFHNEHVDIGASYKSAIKHKLKGKLIIDGLDGPLAALINQRIDGARASFSLPWQIDVGMRYRLTPQLTINGQINRFGWSKFASIQLANLPAVLGDQAIVQNYKDTYSYALGVDYRLSPKATVRGGVQRDLSPIRDGFRDPRVPDGNRWNFAVGGSYDMSDFMGIDVAFNYDKIAGNPIDKPTPAYAGTIAQTNVFEDGVLRNAYALVFSVGGHLSF